jgi:hypothetical protein
MKTDEFIMLKDAAVYIDKKTDAKTVAFPFSFPDGNKGVIMVTRLNKGQWTPIDTIKSIIINYAD